MEYFVNSAERRRSRSTEYHEFRQGKWDGKSHWSDDSIYLHDDHFTRGLVNAIRSVATDYDYYGPTEISASEWEMIGKAVRNEDEKTQNLYQEANSWLAMVFRNHDRFTILGI